MTRAHDENRVRLRREKVGLLLIELAARIERVPGRGNGEMVSPALISQIEHGFVPKHFRRVQIAEVLGTTADALWPEEYA